MSKLKIVPLDDCLELLIVTSNRVVQDWGRYLGDNTMATTILDRLMHRAHLLEFEGKSYRLKEAAHRLIIITNQNPSKPDTGEVN